MLYDGGGKGVWHCPCTLIKEGGCWWEVLHTGVPSQIFTIEVLKPWVNMKSCV